MCSRGLMGNIYIECNDFSGVTRKEYIKKTAILICKALIREVEFNDDETNCNLKNNILTVIEDFITLANLIEQPCAESKKDIQLFAHPDPVGSDGEKGEDGLKVISIQIDARFPHIRP